METPKSKMTATDMELTRSIKRKRMSCKIIRKPNKTKPRQMFDQFYLFGAPPDINAIPSPTLLAMYPSTSSERSMDEVEQIQSFCFPDGFKETKDTKTILKQFVFYMNGGDERLYGVCVHVNNPLGMTCHVTRKFPFCLCLVSACPFLSTHIQFLTFLGHLLCGKIHEKRDEPTSARPPLPVTGFCLPGMILDKSFPAFAVRKKLSIPRFLFEEIVFYQNLSTGSYKEGQSLALEGGFSIDIPYHLAETQRLVYPSLHFLFSSLKVEDIVDVYCGILLEQQVLFVSRAIEKASMCVIAITALIAPFELTSYVMPVVPADDRFRDLFESPIPFVFGAITPVGSADIVVDLDKGTVSMPETLPRLPRKSELVNDLNCIIQNHRHVITVPEREHKSWLSTKVNPEYYKFLKRADPYTFPSSFASGVCPGFIFPPQVIDLLARCFATSIAPELKETARACFVTDTTIPEHPITVINDSLFLSQYQESDKQFWTSFLSTQIATDFCGILADQHSASLSDSSDSPQFATPRRHSNDY